MAAPLGFFKNHQTIITLRNVRILKESKRYALKKKWATTRKTKDASQLALDHFDVYYSPVYGRKWPSIRASILSLPKYCALINNFTDAHDITDSFQPGVFEDFLQIARSKDFPENFHEYVSDLSKNQINNASIMNQRKDNNGHLLIEQELQSQVFNADTTDIYQYMPVQKVISESDEFLEEESKQSIYEPGEIDIKVENDWEINIPSSLEAYCYEQGDVSLFPPPTRDNTNTLAYYLMDAASTLPVIALGLAPGDTVLDLCAAPGGKTLAMLQTLLPEKVVSVDHSYSRLRRLKDILRWYTPKSYHNQEKVEVVHSNGISFCQKEQRQFDKILVDVPCYTDRHVVNENENNIFRRSRMKDRLRIQKLQHSLLTSALPLLKPGGTLVYSTCTLSMPQNDGTVQAVIEDMWRNTDMDVSIINTGPLAYKFTDTFTFYTKCRFGQLVLPNLTSNFGPMYFCKIKRNK